MSTYDNAYEDIYRSILSYCNNFLERNSLEGFEVYEFDCHAVEQSLPDSDLIGLSDYSISNQTDQYIVTCMIIVCTKSDDANLARLRPAIGRLFKELTPGDTGDRFSVIDQQGIRRGYMTVMDDVMVGPIARTQTRPLQAIAVSFGVGYTNLPV